MISSALHKVVYKPGGHKCQMILYKFKHEVSVDPLVIATGGPTEARSLPLEDGMLATSRRADVRLV